MVTDPTADNAELYRSLVELSSEPLCGADTDGSIEAVNGAFLDLTGYPRGELLGTSFVDLLHADEADEWHYHVQLLSNDETTDRTQWAGRIVSKQGTEIPVELDVAVRTEGEEQLGIVVRLRDIREQNQQKQKLSILNRALRHNIRNQMNIVLGKASTLQDVEDEGYRTAAEKIEEIGENVINISNKARKAQKHAGIPRDEDCRRDLVAATRQVHTQFGIRFPGVTVETALPERTPARAPPAFDVALIELLENAVVHNPGDDDWVKVSIEAAESTVAVRVLDRCPPIPEQVQSTIGQGVEQPLHHNDGLGLWIVQWIVESVDGSLAFERRDNGEGNVVTLTFERLEESMNV